MLTWCLVRRVWCRSYISGVKVAHCAEFVLYSNIKVYLLRGHNVVFFKSNLSFILYGIVWTTPHWYIIWTHYTNRHCLWKYWLLYRLHFTLIRVKYRDESTVTCNGVQGLLYHMIMLRKSSAGVGTGYISIIITKQTKFYITKSTKSCF